jgi:hypothetical protein
MSTYVIPLISASPVILYSLLWKFVVFPLLLDSIGPIGAAIITLLIVLFIIVPLIFLPLTGYLGGWDDFQMKTFRKAVVLSGPSKFIIRPFYKMVERGVKANPKLHNRYKIPWENAEREIMELQVMKINNTYVKAEKVNPKDFFLNLAKEKQLKSQKQK